MLNDRLANTDRNISGYLERKYPKGRRKRSLKGRTLKGRTLKGRTWTHRAMHVKGCLICQPI